MIWWSKVVEHDFHKHQSLYISKSERLLLPFANINPLKSTERIELTKRNSDKLADFDYWIRKNKFLEYFIMYVSRILQISQFQDFKIAPSRKSYFKYFFESLWQSKQLIFRVIPCGKSFEVYYSELKRQPYFFIFFNHGQNRMT